ncbi:MFS transporter [Actinomadura verrucosospora]|uniref:Fosmidmycin resistance protein n=1 Tax=Actinomadura verrucosospora TaxID=46165 RepID=A0A7D3VWJ2_ACTVE|nr:MFS transporter [Actinomadura verrucosospora]QKG20956.1 fosmidmycin resistance protein [Actinomadura verrucosospora]
MNRRAPVALLSAGHACVDVYQGAVPAIVPFLVTGRHYSYVAAAGIVLAATLLSSVVQPAFGMLTDRWAMPWLVPAGTGAAGLGVALSGVSDAYPLTWAAIAVSGLGVAAYHPESARIARAVTGGDHAGMSWFSLGGNLGFAAAPLLVTPVIAAGGLHATPWLAVPAVAGTALSLTAMRRRTSGAASKKAAADGRDDRPMFVRLSLVVLCRSVVFFGLSTLLAVVARNRTGGGADAGAVALFVLFAGGAVGTVLGGRLAATLGRVRTLRASYLLAVPAVAGVALAPSYAIYVFVALTAIALYTPFSIQVTLGQDYLPRRIGTASGVTLGLAVSAGGIASPAVGALADAASPRAALLPLIAVPAVAWLLARLLQEPAPLEAPAPLHQDPVPDAPHPSLHR